MLARISAYLALPIFRVSLLLRNRTTLWLQASHGATADRVTLPTSAVSEATVAGLA